MRSRLCLLLASVVMATVVGGTCGGQGLAQTTQGQNGAQGQNGGAGNPAAKPGVTTANPIAPNPYTANPTQAPAPYTTGPYTGNKAGFYEAGRAAAANAHPWAPQPPQFKSLYPKDDPDNPGAGDNPDADQAAGVDMQREGLGGLGGDTKETAADTSHSLTYFEPKVYYWCRGQDGNSPNMYYSDSLATEMAEYHDDFAKKFADFVRTKYGLYLEDVECFPADDSYSAKRDADHSRSADQFRNKSIVNTQWAGDMKDN